MLAIADEELIESAKWYNEQSEGLGERFIAAVAEKLRLIKEYPERYPIKKRNFRETPIKVFPFLIVYKFYKEESLIIINSIFHTSRKPSKKYKR